MGTAASSRNDNSSSSSSNVGIPIGMIVDASSGMPIGLVAEENVGDTANDVANDDILEAHLDKYQKWVEANKIVSNDIDGDENGARKANNNEDEDEDEDEGDAVDLNVDLSLITNGRIYETTRSEKDMIVGEGRVEKSYSRKGGQ